MSCEDEVMKIGKKLEKMISNNSAVSIHACSSYLPLEGGGGGGRAKLIYYASQNKFMILSVETVYIYYEFKMWLL